MWQKALSCASGGETPIEMLGQYNVTWSANSNLTITTTKKAKAVVVTVKDSNYWTSYAYADDSNHYIYREDSSNAPWQSSGNYVLSEFNDNSIVFKGSYTGQNKSCAVTIVY